MWTTINCTYSSLNLQQLPSITHQILSVVKIVKVLQYFVYTIPCKHPMKTIFKKGIKHEDIIATLNTLTTHFQRIAKASDFSLSKWEILQKQFFAPHHPFWKDLLKQKIQIWKNRKYWFSSLPMFSLKFLSPLTINFFLKLFENYEMVCIKMFM
jgi:hypothetical protein